jgi:hypothetical protein
MRAIGRFIASVLVVTGVLLIADVVVTLLWQEPVSALIAHREQTRLSGQLKTLDRLSSRGASRHESAPGTRSDASACRASAGRT